MLDGVGDGTTVEETTARNKDGRVGRVGGGGEGGRHHLSAALYFTLDLDAVSYYMHICGIQKAKIAKCL